MLDPSIRLRNAIKEGNLPITKRILNRYPDLWLNSDPSNNGWCNLHYASYNGNYLVCFHLITFYKEQNVQLKLSSELDMLTFDSLSVLHLPSINHEHQTLHYLLQEFPGSLWLEQKGGINKQTPLQYSCVYGFKEGIKLLLEFGSNWMDQDINGNTCLHLCFQYGHLSCMEALLQYIFSKCESNDERLNLISNLESIKNNKGWLATDLASTFLLIKQYKVMKMELLAMWNDTTTQNPDDDTETYMGFSTSNTPHASQTTFPITVPIPISSIAKEASEDMRYSPSISTLSSFSEISISPLTNKVLTSPMVSVKNDETARSKVRAHSLSLPSESHTASPNSYHSSSMNPNGLTRPNIFRKRSNTTQVNTCQSKPSPRIPNTPIVLNPHQSSHTPSLKSIAFSPQVRDKVSPSHKLQYHSTTSSSPSSQNVSGSPIHMISEVPFVNYRIRANDNNSPTPYTNHLENHMKQQFFTGASRKSSFASSCSSLSIPENESCVISNSNSSRSSFNTFAENESPRRGSNKASNSKKFILKKAKSTTTIQENSSTPLSSAQLRVSTSTTGLPKEAQKNEAEQISPSVSSISFNRVRDV